MAARKWYILSLCLGVSALIAEFESDREAGAGAMTMARRAGAIAHQAEVVEPVDVAENHARNSGLLGTAGVVLFVLFIVTWLISKTGNERTFRDIPVYFLIVIYCMLLLLMV